jgi:mannose-6-phosphate isomerase-like protein (cupin superfamily)
MVVIPILSLSSLTVQRQYLYLVAGLTHFAAMIHFFRARFRQSLPMLSFCLFFFSAFHSAAQNFQHLASLTPKQEYENVHVEKISGDSLQSSFVIWVKQGVKEHYHMAHSESVFVLEGEGMMSLGDDLFLIRPGDYVFIPKGTPHSVTQVMGNIPLKVLSIQAPIFDGTDRVFTGD